MQALVNFLTLRPTFTFFGLRIVWYTYLVNLVIQTYNTFSNISKVLAQRGAHLEIWSHGFIALLFSLVSQLLIARLLLEVAAIIISESRTSKGSS